MFFISFKTISFPLNRNLAMQPAEPITVIIADDHPFVRRGFITFLENRDDSNYHVVAEAPNGIELIDKVKIHQPQIVITDILMPEMGGLQACRIIKENYPAIHVIAFTLFENENLILEMIRAGASGYIFKNSLPKEILSAIKRVSEGIPYYSNLISDKLATGNNKSNTTKAVQFSTQEIKVIKLICKQLTNKEIAETTQLHIRTIEDQRHKIQEKMNIKNGVGVLSYALMHGLVGLSEL